MNLLCSMFYWSHKCCYTVCFTASLRWKPSVPRAVKAELGALLCQAATVQDCHLQGSLPSSSPEAAKPGFPCAACRSVGNGSIATARREAGPKTRVSKLYLHYRKTCCCTESQDLQPAGHRNYYYLFPKHDPTPSSTLHSLCICC